MENSERSVRGVRMGKSGPLERAELANQIQGFRIPDRWDASEKNNYWYYTSYKLKVIWIDNIIGTNIYFDRNAMINSYSLMQLNSIIKFFIIFFSF